MNYKNYIKKSLVFAINLMLIVTLSATNLIGQTVQIGLGTTLPTNTLYGPVYRFSATSTTTATRCDILYTAAEMSAAGIPAGATITSIEFYKGNTANFVTPATNHKVYMANTSNTSLATTLTWASVLSTHTLVYSSASFNLPNTIGWVPWIITPFNYTGGALEIATEMNMGGNGAATNNFLWQYSGASGSSASLIVGAASTTLPTTLNGTVADYKNRPNIRITYTAGGCTSPPTPGSASATPSSGVCIGANIALSLSGNSSGSGQTYQWQSSLTGGGVGFSNLGSSQTTPLLNTPATTSMFYRCLVTCSGNTQTSTEVPVTVNPGLSGIYTINASLATGGSNFQTFAAAITALNCGVSGAVVFNVDSASGPYTEQITIPVISGSSASNTVTFNGNGAILQFTPVTAARHIIKLDGADYVILNNLRIKGLATDFDWGIHLINSANNNSITNCNIDMSANTSTTQSNSACIVACNSTTTVTTAGNNASNLTINNCTINGAYQGIILNGLATGLNAVANIITNNTITNTYGNGIELSHNDGALVQNNNISRPTRTTALSGSAGIELAIGCRNIIVNSNKIHDTHNLVVTQTGTSYGVYLNACDAPVGSENRIINNLVYNFNSTNGTQYGLYNSSSDGAYYYHNTIVLNNSAVATAVTYGFYQLTLASNIVVKNNIIYVSRGGTGAKNCLRFGTVGSGIISNTNDLYINSTGGVSGVGYYSTNFPTLVDWQGANSSVWDQQSKSVNPGFISPGTGNYIPSSGLINNIGENLGVATDITGAPRSATPDLGAYEFVPPTLDAIITWVAPAAPITAGPNTVTVNIFNNQATTITSIDIEYTDGITPIAESFTGLNITTGNNQSLNFTTPYTISGDITLRAYISLVNGLVDGDQNNDSTPTQNLCLPLPAGSYTINSALATSGTNFQTFSAAASRMVSCGIAGPVVFDVVAGSGPYIEQVNIPSIPGTSAVNTVTFEGHNCTLSQTLTGTPTNYATLNLSGADYLIFNNLNVEALGATYGFGIHLMNASNNNAFNNCNIYANTTGTGTTSCCVSISGSAGSYSATGINGSNNLFSGCTTTGGYFGFSFYGDGSSYLNNANNSIVNCTVQDYYVYGSYNYYQGNSTISGNIFQRPTRTTVSTGYGVILTTGTVNVLVEKNRVRNLFGGAPSSTSTGYGLYCAIDALPGLENKFYNNVVSNINSEGIIYTMYLSGANFVKAYHNTLVIDHPAAATASATYGIYASGASGVDIRNNIVFIRRGGTGAKTCVYYTTVPSISNNNDLYFDPIAGTNYIGYNGTSYATLSAWQLNSGLDLQSKNIDPLFTNPGTGDFTPMSAAMNAFGANVGVTTDINGGPRVVPFPDPGAFEFSIPGLDAAISWVSPVNPGIAGANSITVNIGNLRSTTITSLSLAYTDGVTPVTQSFTGLNILPSTAQQFTFTTPYNLISSANLSAYISSVNTIADDDQTNDTVTQNLCIELMGVYTINAAAPASPTNFQNFTAVVNALSCGISGPVVFNVSNGPYNEQINVLPVGGSSAVNTITFNCFNQTITYDASASSYNATLNLSGADYFTFNDLNVVSTGATEAWGIHLMDSSNHNNFNNCSATVNITSTSTSTQAVVMNGSNITYSTGGSGGNNNTFANCTFTGGYYGVVLYGISTSGNSGNIFDGCHFKDAYTYSTYNVYSTNGIIRNCIIERPARTNPTTGAGVYLTTGCANMLIEKNRVRNMFGGLPTSTGTCYGFADIISASAGNENKFYNNVISDLNFNGTIYGLYFSAGNYIKAYHNTISLDHTASTATAVTYGIYSTGTIGLDFRNNMVTITRGGTGTKYGLYYTGTVTTSNYNDVVVASGAGTNNVGYNGTAYPTMLAWQGATTYDAQSISTAPGYADPVNGDFTPTVPTVNNKGIAVGITTDILGASRNLSTPDIGAFEADFSPIDLGATALVAPGNSGCYSNAETVIIKIKNYGTDTLDFSVTPATVTCNITGTTTATLTGSPSGTLNPGSFMDVTLTSGTVDMSVTGSYTFNAFTTIPGDGKASNDNMAAATRSKVVLVPGTAGANFTDYCVSGTPTLTLAGSAGGNIQWQSSISGSSGPWTNVGTGATTYIPSSPITQITYIRAFITCQTTSDSSNVVIININNPQPLTTTGATRCGIGSVTLQGTVSGGGSLSWYAAPTGGTSLGTGTSFVTPTIPSTTNFYVAAISGSGTTFTGMPAALSTATSGAGTTNFGLVFDALSPFTLNSVTVYPVSATSASGTVTVDVINSAGTVLNTATFNVVGSPAGTPVAHVLNVNFNIAAGTNLKMRPGFTGITGLLFEPAASAPGGNYGYPFVIPGVVSINTSTLAAAPTNTPNNALYYYFYNWSINVGCEGTRVPVTATVTPSPALSIVAGSTTLCQGTSTTLSVGTGLGDYNSFGWSPATGLSATTGTSVTATPSVTTKYYLGALNSSSGCQAVDSVVITVNSVSINMSVDNPLVCANGTAQLNANAGAGTFNYAWTPSTGLSSSSIANPIATLPSPSTTYTVLVTDAGTGCTKTSSITLYKSDPQVISSSVNNRCGPGPVTFQATGTPGTVNWWSASTGGTLIATGSPYVGNISANTTYYAAIKDVIPQTPVSTGFGGATTATDPNAAGNMFNVIALHDLTITGFDIHLNNNVTLAPSNISVYYKAGTYIGFNNNAAAWTLAGSVTGLTSSGNGVPTSLPLSLALNIPAGQTYGIYIVVTNLGVANSLRYFSNANSPAEGAVASSDYNLQVTSGTVSFGPFTGVPAAPINRLWNGRVKYTIGCESGRTAVAATVSTPPAINISGTTSICQGDSATINVTSPNDPDYTYTWNPGGLIGSTVNVSPTSTTTYTVTAVDNSSGSDSGCINIGTYSLTVFPAPVISSMQASPNLICGGGTPVTLTALTGTSVPGIANIGTQSTTIGGTNGNPYRSGNGVGNQVHTQVLVLASELTAGGLSAGNLTSLGFTTTGAAGTVVNFTIKIGNTALSTLTTSFVTTPMTTVFTQATFVPALGLNTHLFSTPFIWDGASNIIIDVCQQNSVLGTTTVAAYTPGYASNTHVGAVGGCSAITGVAVANKPIMKIGGSFGTSGPGTFQWQWSPGALPAGNVVTTTPTVTTMFKITATAPGTGCFTKDSILVNVTQVPHPYLQEGDSVLCSNDAGFEMHVLDTGAYTGGYPAGTIINFYGAGGILYQNGTSNTFFNANNSDAFYAEVTLPGSIGSCYGLSDTSVMDFGNAQAPQYMLTTDSVKCFGESNGKAMAEITFGGTPRFRWQWYNSSHLLVRDVTSASLFDTLAGMPEGMYTIAITDHQDSLTSPYCSVIDSIFIGQPEAPLSATENTGNHVNVLCNGASTGVANLDVSGGTPSYSYSWSNGASTKSVSGLAAGTYTCTITDSRGCTTTGSVTIIQPSAIVLNCTATNAVCFNSNNGTASVTASGGTPGYTYLWSTSAATSSIGGLTPGTYTVTVTDANGCTKQCSSIVSQPAPLAVTISGNSGICQGGSTILNAGAGYSVYSWSTGATTQTITVSAAATYTVSVTNGSGCTGTGSVTTTINPKPVPTITGATTVCVSTTTLISASAGFNAYSWSTGATTQSVTAGGGTYTVTVTNANGCTGTASKTISITTGVPAQPGVITGSTVVCKNSDGNYSIAVMAGVTGYTWTAIGGATISAGQGTNAVTVHFSNTAVSSTLSVVANNVCGSGTARTLAYTVSSVIPAAPAGITGTVTGVCGLTLSYTCSAVANATSYLWTVPTGATIMSGQGTSTVSVKFGTFTGTGTLSVIAQSGCGNSAATSKTVDAKPQQPVISGANFACQYQTGVSYSVAAIPGATSYTWQVVAGSTLVSGQGTTSIVVNWGAINGVIKCTASNGCASSLPGSKPVSFTCKEEGSLFDFTEINLYPNPASTSATIQFDAFTDGEGQVFIYDMIGKQMLKEELKVLNGNNQYNIDLNTYPKGTYIVKVIYKGFTRNCKLIVK